MVEVLCKWKDALQIILNNPFSKHWSSCIVWKALWYLKVSHWLLVHAVFVVCEAVCCFNLMVVSGKSVKHPCKTAKRFSSFNVWKGATSPMPWEPNLSYTLHCLIYLEETGSWFTPKHSFWFCEKVSVLAQLFDLKIVLYTLAQCFSTLATL